MGSMGLARCDSLQHKGSATLFFARAANPDRRHIGSVHPIHLGDRGLQPLGSQSRPCAQRL